MNGFYRIPVTILDILVIAIAVILLLALRGGDFFDEEGIKALTPLKRIGIILVGLMMFTGGIALIYFGIKAPLQLHSTIRGSLHGYGLAITGAILILMGTGLIYSPLRFRKNKET
ncbi:MAG: hypothetical protein PQJ59_10170 [Spirochaetales bacterium]|nr:hypothetical protein [Spirochaetales bacterium]